MNAINSLTRRKIASGSAAPKRQAKISSMADILERHAGPKKSKYRNVATIIDGIRFASKLEGRRYSELKLLERAGQIRNLELQRRFPIEVQGQKICAYVADFAYEDRQKDHGYIVEDAKGMMTPIARIKLKLMKAVYGIDVQLIKK